MIRAFAIFSIALISVTDAEARLSPEQLKRLPAAVTREVNFAKDVKPIFESSCIKCHGRGRDKGNFRIDSRETLLKGGDSGPALVSGKGAESLLVELVSGLDPDNVMPKKGSKLTAEQIAILRAWVDQGAKWDDSITFARQAPKNLHPHEPKLALKKNEHPIDAILNGYFQQTKTKAGKVVSDEVFARRAYLDVIGLLPSPEQLQQFVSDRKADKRTVLIRELLSNRKGYAEHWLTFWNDALRNDYRGTGYIDGGRKQISAWLFRALAENWPYDRFVAELINPNEASAGFSKGIVWRGVVNASQVPPMQAAQNISQVFMGVNLKCASCHDSFINDWTLAESYALANIYSDEPLEIAQCDKPTGRKAGIQFLYPELGSIQNKTNKAARLKELAEIMTSQKNGRLSRTIVNRLWAKFFGRGLVEPVDDMEGDAWSQDMLDWLAEDLVAHQYDLKHTIEVMLTSRAYQLPAISLDPNAKSFAFTGPLIRRLSAEQYRDALGSLTGMWYSSVAGEFDFSCLDPRTDTLSGKWIWADAEAATKAPAGTVYFRKTIELSSDASEAIAVVTCDNSYTLSVNGENVASGKDYGRPQFVDLKSRLKKGTNVFAVKAVNNLPDNKAPGDQPAPASAANPAGFFLFGRIKAGNLVANVSSDSSWKWSRAKEKGWEAVSFNDEQWQSASELGGPDAAPWKGEKVLAGAMMTRDFQGKTRAALANADSLTVCLGRPNREQVMTTRSSAATTLQALELTNGETLAKVVEAGASKLLSKGAPSADALVKSIYQKALGREPSRDELKLASGLVGSPVKPEGVQDFIWSIAMLPEFQLIY